MKLNQSGEQAISQQCEEVWGKDADRDLPLPYGGILRNLLVTERVAEELKPESQAWPSWDLSHRQLCDLELLLNGGFSPLTGFMGRADYEQVCEEMRLADGTLWPIPIVLDVTAAFAKTIQAGSRVALRDTEGVMLAVITVSDIWQPDLRREAKLVYDTTDREHPGVNLLLQTEGDRCYVGGRIQGLQLPSHYDFPRLRYTPQQLRTRFRRWGWRKVIAFQTRNPMHQAHFRMTLAAAMEHKANLLIHPVAGMTKPGDVHHACRVRCYEAVMSRYPTRLAELSLLPLSMRMAGPREAVWHAIVRRNYGCSHLIVGRDHAGPARNGHGRRSFYEPYAAQELLSQHKAELGVQMVPFKHLVYIPVQGEYLPADQMPSGCEAHDISGSELRKRVQDGAEIPEWFTFPEVVTELRWMYPPRAQQGFTVFFTGLSGSGKSTLARALLEQLLEIGRRPVTLLDRDNVRKHLSSELGFSRDHRNLNILRIGFVATEITKNRGIAICAPIAPYDSIRKAVRSQISQQGGFVLVYLATPLAVCERRDPKGLYAKARAGLLKDFTGLSDPYEVPSDAELVLDTGELTVMESCKAILRHLRRNGYLPAAEPRHATWQSSRPHSPVRCRDRAGLGSPH